MVSCIVHLLLLFCLTPNMNQAILISPVHSSVEPTWNINAVKAPQFWNTTNYRGEGVVIAILDNGVNYTLPDLDDNYLGGYDFVDNDTDPMPSSDYDHGTPCASIAVGEGDQTYVGVAPKAKYYALRVGDAEPNPTYIWKAIYWALHPDHRADVISLSLATIPPSSDPDDWPLKDRQDFYNLSYACEAAWKLGVVVVASTGNDNKNYPFYPAGFGHIISVGGYTQGGAIPGFSNCGADLVAPGGEGDVPALGNNGEIIDFGRTSAAAPHVAGAVALLLSRRGRYQPDEVRQILRVSATPLADYGSWEQGAGLVNCLDIINYRAFLDNAGFENYYMWSLTEPFNGEANIFENSYWWKPPPLERECKPGIDYFDSLEGDLHVNLSLTSTSPGQNVYAGMEQLSDWFNLAARGASRTTRELHTALRTLTINVGTCEKARIAIKISFSQNKRIYYCWYARGSDTNTTDTCYYNLGTATNQTIYTLTRDVKQDFYNAFATPLTFGWKITSIICEITIDQTSNYDHISLLIGEARLFGNYTNRLVADINYDGVVNMKDVYGAVKAFGSSPGDPDWNPNADVNNDLTVDMKDIYFITSHIWEVD